jgi:hypothetical protein
MLGKAVKEKEAEKKVRGKRGLFRRKLGAVAQNWALGAMLKNALFGLLMVEIKLYPKLVSQN